jgi:polyadenylate-binding protein
MTDKYSKNFQVNTPHQVTKNVLVISDLADNVNEQDLNIFFENFRESILVIQYNRSRSEYLGAKANSATIIFKEFKEAEKAKYSLNMRKLKGKTVRITWHERDSLVRYNNQVNVYVKSIPLNVSPREFYEYFCTFGDVVSAKLVENEDGNHLGYGYVHFASTETKNKCIEDSNDKEIWPGSKLVVENFQKKQERSTQDGGMNPNKSIFMKNFPSDYDEKKIKELIGDVKVTWMRIMSDSKDRSYAIVILESEEDAAKLKALNKTVLNGQELFVDNLMNKLDRKRYLVSKINDTNMQLTRKFRDCNLHIRNLPTEMDEDGLRKLFSAFGDIKSVKIPTTTTVTKIKGEFKETLTSCCFGYICYNDSVAAKKAFEEMNSKIIDGCKRPLIINYFMPKNERSQAFNSTGGAFNKKNMNWDGLNMNYTPFSGDMMMKGGNQPNLRQFPQGGNNMHQQQGYNQKGKFNNNYNQTGGQQTPIVPVTQVTEQPIKTPVVEQEKKDNEPDYELIKNMEDDTSKKDYLGEYIFRKIESHQLTEMNNMSMDHIGKITGMILGIEDVNEIIDICKNTDHLTSRIIEALNLLNSTN